MSAVGIDGTPVAQATKSVHAFLYAQFLCQTMARVAHNVQMNPVDGGVQVVQLLILRQCAVL